MDVTSHDFHFIYLFIVLIVLVVIIATVWRFASHRYAIPCPVWMRWLLDTPFAKGMSARTRKTIRRLDLRAGMKVLEGAIFYV